jgi:transcription initiation factor TFIIB
MVHMNSNKDGCPRCAKGKLIVLVETSERCCQKCGYVVDEVIVDAGAEWRSNAGTDRPDRSRAGTPTTLAMHDQGLATKIGSDNKDATGKRLTSEMRYTIKRLRTWDGRYSVATSKDKNFVTAFAELKRLESKLTLNSVISERAAYIYRKALEAKLVRGRSINALIAASLYAACRQLGVTRNLKDFELHANIKRKDIARCYRLLLKSLGVQMPVVDPVSCVAKIASGKIDITEKSKRYAVKILKEASEKHLSSGKDPMGLAASALYLACVKNGEDITQRDIAQAADVTEVTIRNRYKGLKDMQTVDDKMILSIEQHKRRTTKLTNHEKYMQRKKRAEDDIL